MDNSLIYLLMEVRALKKFFIIATAILTSVLLILVMFIVIKIHMVVKNHDELIYRGISIDEIDVSLLSKDRAVKKVTENTQFLNKDRKILIYAEEEVYETSFAELNIRENIEEIVDLALTYCKNDKVIDKYKYITKGVQRNFKTSITFDEDPFDIMVKKIKKEQNMAPINALIEHDWSGFKITPHQVGKSVDEAELKRNIKEQIEDCRDGEDIIVNVIFKTDEPKIYDSDLKSVDTLVSTYSTIFSTSGFGRARNIEIAAGYINNRVIMPGEEFSFNKIVGAATSGKGYSYAKVIKNGVYIDEVGGGICQVSSTLYNAVLKTSLSITERRNHSKVINYVPKGQDAMIAYGVSDFKFINTFKYPVLVEAIVENKNLTFNIYSNKEGKEHIYQVRNEIAKEIKPKKEIIYDYSIDEGTVIVEQEGKSGYVINTYRVKYKDEEIVEKILVTESVYAGKNKIVRIGKD